MIVAKHRQGGGTAQQPDCQTAPERSEGSRSRRSGSVPPAPAKQFSADEERTKALERVAAHRRSQQQQQLERESAELARKAKYAAFDAEAMRTLAVERSQDAKRALQQREATISDAMERKRRDASDRRLKEAEDKEQRRAEIYALNALMRERDQLRWEAWVAQSPAS